MSFARDCRSSVVPGVRYHNAVAMMEWLHRAFGFEQHSLHMDGDVVMHAEMSFGNGMIMIGGVDKETPYSQYAVHPEGTGGRETHSVSLLVEDCDAIYATAKAAGAEMIFDLEEKPYGGKSFSCRDPEGYIWHVGSYNPWAAQPAK